jgi:hypothetical protein
MKSNTNKAINTMGKAIIACSNIIVIVLEFCLVYGLYCVGSPTIRLFKS